MTFNVFGKVIGPHKLAITYGTSKTLFAGVSTSMTRQLIRTGESLIARLPRTRKRLLTFKQTTKSGSVPATR